jgi:ABC-type polysaccharide/polyol phosphate export permease
MRANPLTYGVEALRAALYPQMGNGLGLSTTTCLGVLGAVSLVMFAIAFAMVNRRRAGSVA